MPAHIAIFATSLNEVRSQKSEVIFVTGMGEQLSKNISPEKARFDTKLINVCYKYLGYFLGVRSQNELF
ncbi:hypothetical protein [Okeania sp. SIO1I7]|uniref:hypothetical protein n=1 Tax=Okeania sp. SIO1I7 TaxID=2607772 RepID=UPI0013F975D9|nr:hypothetical protein [Okeania sp. SIO1I7]NET24158.1 hypothetical protein [Okeania sp. SIO1I7]